MIKNSTHLPGHCSTEYLLKLRTPQWELAIMLNEFKYRIKQHVINEVVLGLPSLRLCVYSNMIVLMITPRGDRGRRRRRGRDTEIE